MTPENKAKIKKYLFYISIFFATIIIGHLGYLFLFHDSSETPSQGGVLSEAVIGKMPSLNPLKNENEINSYIMSLSYRSIMSYNPQTKKFEADIAECDLTKLEYIKCYVQPDLKWSDGSDITPSDVATTLQILKKHNLNSNSHTLLLETTIEEGKDYVALSNLKKDINFLNILTQPIVKKEVINKLNEETLHDPFNPFAGIYSGKYVIVGPSVNDSIGINQLSLSKNPLYDKNNYIEKINIKFFEDESKLVKNQDQIKALYDTNKILTGTNPRFDIKEHTLNQYTSVYINAGKIKNKEFRATILSKINRESILDSLGKGYSEIKNPFMSEQIIDRMPIDKNIVGFMKELGYYKKSELVGNVIDEKEKSQVQKYFDDNNPNATYIASPLTKKYNFITDNWLLKENKDAVFSNKYSVLFKGDTKGESPDQIIINDYALQGYEKGDQFFYYRVKESAGNFKLGENNYKVYFVFGEEKKLVDEINVFYQKTEEEIEEIKKTLETALKEKLKKDGALESEIAEKEVNTIDELEKDFFYNVDKEAFTLELFYINSNEASKIIAENIEKDLLPLGIKTNITGYSISEIGEMLVSGEKHYDILISGSNLGYFPYNIFPYFHSSQAKKGFNISGIKKPELDIGLENLKEFNLSNEKKIEISNGVLEILKEEQVVKTIHTPKMYYIIDKNVKQTAFLEELAYPDDRIYYYNNAYITSDKKINTEEKTLFNFIKFLYDIIND